jgi:hypothetical protein
MGFVEKKELNSKMVVFAVRGMREKEWWLYFWCVMGETG